MPHPRPRRPWHRPDSFLLAWLVALGQAVLAAIVITGEWIEFLNKDHHGYGHYAMDRGMTIILTALAAPLLASAVFLLWRHRATAGMVVIGQLALAGVAVWCVAGFAGIPLTVTGWLVVAATIPLPVVMAVCLGRYIHISQPLSASRR